MTFFEWRPELALGITHVDDQHKGLIDLMNRLYESNVHGAPMRERRAILDELIAKTRTHFAEEERYMESINYDGLATHRRIHQGMLAKLDASRASLEGATSVPPAVFNFLKFWLSAHIAGIDAKYVKIPHPV